jgi:SHS2 domain-containing protein
MYEFFEHTADIGLRVHASDLNTLMTDAARAVFAVIVTNPEAVRPAERVDFEIAGEQLDDLLHDWLSELLVSFDTRHILFGRFEVNKHATGLTASAWGERLDPARHHVGMEVKAITYHGLRVEREGQGWLAEVIVDI